MRVVSFDRVREDVAVLMDRVDDERVGWMRDEGEDRRRMDKS